MRPYAEVIGDPIGHSKSPMLHRFWLAALGIDAGYRAVRVSTGQLQPYVRARRRDLAWLGCNITAPLKQHAFLLVDELSDRAKRIGAINLILRRGGRLIGDNSDLDGIAEAIPASSVSGTRAILIGAGGAARPAIDHLLSSGAARIQILARTPERAHAMCPPSATSCSITVAGLDAQPCADATMLINASPIGMKHALMPASIIEMVSSMNPDGMVFDMVYEPLKTPLLKAARSAGLRTADGLAMLIGQAAGAFEGFFGKAPPRELDEGLRWHLTTAGARQVFTGADPKSAAIQNLPPGPD